MSMSISAPKLQKLPPTGVESMETGISNQRYATILELALPFLPLEEETFPNVSVVSKGMHELCVAQLRQHCQTHHPVLLLLAELNLQHDVAKEDNWLTYGRYRRFLRTEGECQPQTKEEDAYPEWLDDYEMILELSTLGDEPKVIAYDIQPLIYEERDQPIWTAFAVGNAGDKLLSLHESVRVRVLMRRKSTGELANIMNQTSYESRDEIDVTEAEEYESGMAYFYATTNTLLKDEVLHAAASFQLYKNYAGNMIFDDSDHPEQAFHFCLHSSKSNPELLARAIDTWNWF